MQNIIKIGTRNSQLALWQANKVRRELEALGYETEIVPIQSSGDMVLNKPIYELGITGVFTKNLDIALLNNEIDIAVHSMKDVPTLLAEGIVQVAVLKRANPNDILVLKDNEEFFAQEHAVIATGSLRRTAQWLNRYPTHTLVDLRGNVNTRLEKLEENDWNGAIFAAAGLERIGKRPKGAVNLSWMIPAPAQGAIMVTALAENQFAIDAASQLNHPDSELCTTIEREFLNRLEGGCTAPIGAYAFVDEKTKEINFKGVLLSRDGSKKISVSKNAPVNRHRYLAKDCADYIINKGGKELMLADAVVEASKKAYIFSTKSLSESQVALFDHTIGVESSDFIKIRFNRISPKVIKEPIEHVIITSKNGVESILNSFTKDELVFKNIYCVGRRTKKLIEKKIGPVAIAEKNAKALASVLVKKLKGQEVTYFCSDLRLDTLPQVLSSKGVKVQEVVAYKTMMSADSLDEKIDGVMFYSPSTVSSYLEQNSPNKIAFCIGESTAKEARDYFSTVYVAEIPTVESLIELVNTQYLNS